MLLTTSSKVNAVKKLIRERKYDDAVEIADRIDPEKVSSVYDLSVIADAYMKRGRLDEAKHIYLVMYERNKSHKVMTGLIELSLKLKQPKDAERFLREFRRMEPDNPERLVYRYRVDSMLGKDPEYLVKSLAKLKNEEYTDVWALELAKAYYKSNDREACAAECHSIIKYFPESEVAKKATVLLGACELDDDTPEMPVVTEEPVDTADMAESLLQDVSAMLEENAAAEAVANEVIDEKTLAAATPAHPEPQLRRIEFVTQSKPAGQDKSEYGDTAEEEAEAAAATMHALRESYTLPDELKGQIDNIIFEADDDDDDDIVVVCAENTADAVDIDAAGEAAEAEAANETAEDEAEADDEESGEADEAVEAAVETAGLDFDDDDDDDDDEIVIHDYYPEEDAADAEEASDDDAGEEIADEESETDKAEDAGADEDDEEINDDSESEDGEVSDAEADDDEDSDEDGVTGFDDDDDDVIESDDGEDDSDDSDEEASDDDFEEDADSEEESEDAFDDEEDDEDAEGIIDIDGLFEDEDDETADDDDEGVEDTEDKEAFESYEDVNGESEEVFDDDGDVAEDSDAEEAGDDDETEPEFDDDDPLVDETLDSVADKLASQILSATAEEQRRRVDEPEDANDGAKPEDTKVMEGLSERALREAAEDGDDAIERALYSLLGESSRPVKDE